MAAEAERDRELYAQRAALAEEGQELAREDRKQLQVCSGCIVLSAVAGLFSVIYLLLFSSVVSCRKYELRLLTDSSLNLAGCPPYPQAEKDKLVQQLKETTTVEDATRRKIILKFKARCLR